jgi:hypothetical protein
LIIGSLRNAGTAYERIVSGTWARGGAGTVGTGIVAGTGAGAGATEPPHPAAVKSAARETIR